MKKTLIKLILWGMLFALAAEIFNNFIINDASYLLLLTIIPIYILFFFVVFGIYTRLKLSPRAFCLIIGLIGLIIIENIILKKSGEQWPIQIFMFSYWFSIVSYPMILLSKSKKILIKPFVISLVISTGYLVIFKDVPTTMSLSMVSFFVASAVGNFFYLKQVKV